MRDALRALRSKMQSHNVDLYLVTSDDFHMSEYVGDFFKCREFLTGFTGSAGTALVSMDEAFLFTDGRYFLQAEQELSGTGFTLCKIGEPDVPTLWEAVRDRLPLGGTLSFDGRTVSAETGEKLNEIVTARKGIVRSDVDFIGEIWDHRPEMAENPLWILDARYAGETVSEKAGQVRKLLHRKKADALVLTAPEDVMWLLNLRGNDVTNTPVALCYLILTEGEIRFFPREKALTEEVRTYLSENGVIVDAYGRIYDAVSEFPENTKVFLSMERVNDRLYRKISEKYTVVRGFSPTSLLKAVKNETERQNLRKAHVKDGAALVKALRLIDLKAASAREKCESFTEWDAARIIDNERRKQDGFVDVSFETISGFGANGAIIHYEPRKETAAEIENRSFLLLDSGGHYLEGTTDITRTLAMGPLTPEEKKAYTLVLKGHLALAMAEFPAGTAGGELDSLVRAPLWKEGLDYRHGTGHGIGYLLSVHEWPANMNRKSSPERKKEEIFKPGMLTSDEPGVYVEGKFGVRIENDLLCKEIRKTEYGCFYGFENLTLCPIDTRPVLTELLTEDEKAYLNAYHKRVYAELYPLLSTEEREWLQAATREI